MNIADIRSHFCSELFNENFTTDRSGMQTIELLGASFIANEESIFGKPNQDYIETELEWYESESTNINDIYPDRDAPEAWQMTANEHGEINSNYGHLIYGEKYHNQYDQVVEELTQNPDSRRASMIYTRPSIWIEYNENGKNDFICTNSVSYYIRDNALHCVVQMRSNDVMFGYRNDWAWQDYVLRHLANDLETEVGDIHWQVQNLHIYKRHFHMVK